MNGIDFLQNIRADEHLSDIPVIALTGSMDPHQLERLQELGVAELMPKARFTVEQLLERVRAHLACGAAYGVIELPRGMGKYACPCVVLDHRRRA